MKPLPGLGILASLFLALTVIMPVTAGKVQAADAVEKCDIFTPQLREMLPPEISNFVERYLYARLHKDKDKATTRRRLDFDEVSMTFPLKESSLEPLRSADGLSISLERGTVYRLRWLKGRDTLAEMSFPASYKLIMFTDQKNSYEWMCNRIRELSQQPDSLSRFIGKAPGRRRDPIRRSGAEFYLGHLTSDFYLDSESGRPVWSEDYPAESVANLFIHSDAVADVDVELSLKGYTGDAIVIRLPFHRFNSLMRDLGCQPYYGVSEMNDETGEMEALVVYHNPTVAYIHKMDVKVQPETVWRQDEERPLIKAEMLLYIGLHNLIDLWGEK